jgi:hypothetical protein
VIGAILSPKSARIVSSGGGDHILDGGVAGSGGVAEVLCGADGLGRDLRLLGLRRRRACVVRPDSGKNAGLVAGMRAGSATGDGACGHALAILSDTVEPGAAADAAVEVLQSGCFAAGVIVVPLRQPHQRRQSAQARYPARLSIARLPRYAWRPRLYSGVQPMNTPATTAT